MFKKEENFKEILSDSFECDIKVFWQQPLRQTTNYSDCRNLNKTHPLYHLQKICTENLDGKDFVTNRIATEYEIGKRNNEW